MMLCDHYAHASVTCSASWVIQQKDNTKRKNHCVAVVQSPYVSLIKTFWQDFIEAICNIIILTHVLEGSIIELNQSLPIMSFFKLLHVIVAQQAI